MAKTVYIGIVGDIIHPGIINIINEGAKRGEVIVGLLSDKAIVNHKRLPYLSYEQRKTVVENIKGVSTDIFEDDSKQAEKAFKSYLTIDSAKDYTDVKKLVTNQFTSESNFVKMFFESDTFTNKMSFKSLDVIMKSWSEDGSVAYNGILSYTVNGKEHRRLVTFTMFYNTDDRTSRDLKDVQVNDAEFM